MLVGLVLAPLTLVAVAFVHHWLLLRVSPDGRVPAVRGWLPYVGWVGVGCSRAGILQRVLLVAREVRTADAVA